MAIIGCIGRGGSGKTLRTVCRLWRLYKSGRTIVSNTPLVDLRYRWSVAAATFVPLDAATFGRSWASDYARTLDDVYTIADAEVFLDELAAWCPAHKHKSIPDEFRRVIAQDRREGLNIHWTHRTTKVFHEIRDNTKTIEQCVKWWGGLSQVVSYDPQDPAERLKRFFLMQPRHFHLYQTFARVGSATGDGFGLGALARKQAGRTYYAPPGYPLQLCVVDSPQRTLLTRMFGAGVFHTGCRISDAWLQAEHDVAHQGYAEPHADFVPVCGKRIRIGSPPRLIESTA